MTMLLGSLVVMVSYSHLLNGFGRVDLNLIITLSPP